MIRISLLSKLLLVMRSLFGGRTRSSFSQLAFKKCEIHALLALSAKSVINTLVANGTMLM